MTVQELVEKDSSFNESTFLSKANNRIKNLYQSITLNELERLKAFVSDSFYQELEKKINSYHQDGIDVFYDEVNVSSTIRSIWVENDYSCIDVIATVRYLKYFVSSETGEYVSGDQENRKTVTHIVTFKKRFGDTSDVYRCFGCGSTISIENEGKCPTCGRIYDLASFEYIIDQFI